MLFEFDAETSYTALLCDSCREGICTVTEHTQKEYLSISSNGLSEHLLHRQGKKFLDNTQILPNSPVSPYF